jgi:hypothetical protein
VRARLPEGWPGDVPGGDPVAGGGQRRLEEDPPEPAQRGRVVAVAPVRASEQLLMTPPQESASINGRQYKYERDTEKDLC